MRRPRFRLHRPSSLTGVVALVALCASYPAAQGIDVTGAGATFPYPIYSAWFAEYSKIQPDLRISYQSIGSGGGIRQLTDLFVFFGATDTPMTTDELLAAPRRILHVPTVASRRTEPRRLRFT